MSEELPPENYDQSDEVGEKTYDPSDPEARKKRLDEIRQRKLQLQTERKKLRTELHTLRDHLKSKERIYNVVAQEIDTITYSLKRLADFIPQIDELLAKILDPRRLLNPQVSDILDEKVSSLLGEEAKILAQINLLKSLYEVTEEELQGLIQEEYRLLDIED